MERRWVVCVVWAVILWSGVGWAQSPVGLKETLRRLGDESAAYRSELPEFTCKERVATSEKRRWRALQKAEFAAKIRVVRGADGALQESYVLTEFAGKPVTGPGVYPTGVYVVGGFARGGPVVFAPDKQRCYVFSMKGQRVDFEALPGCDEPRGTVGFAELDGAGELAHTETRRRPEEAGPRSLTTLTVVDYASVTLRSEVYRLPVKLYAEMQSGGELRTFAAEYSECNLFKVTTTIRPAGGVDEAPQ